MSAPVSSTGCCLYGYAQSLTPVSAVLPCYGYLRSGRCGVCKVGQIFFSFSLAVPPFLVCVRAAVALTYAYMHV